MTIEEFEAEFTKLINEQRDAILRANAEFTRKVEEKSDEWSDLPAHLIHAVISTGMQRVTAEIEAFAEKNNA